MNDIAIVVVAFNRDKSLKRLLNSLNALNVSKDDEVPLYISIDRAKEENLENKSVLKIANEFKWKFGEKVVDYKAENMGLRKHILECGKLTNKYENIIVLEDDIVVSPLMYKYAKQVIDYYKGEEKIAGFGVYSFQRNPVNNLPFYPINNGNDVYFMQYACSWGQIWTRDRWNDFYDWYKKNKDVDFSNNLNIPKYINSWGENSWLKFHIIYTILNNKFFVYPYIGLTTNFTDAGTHNKLNSIAYQTYMYFDNNKDVNFKFSPIDESYNIYDAFFENMKLKEIINCNKNIICDFYGKKTIEYIESKPGYLLSTKKYNYRIIKSYSLQMYPYEMNLVNEIYGKDIFLYDQEKTEKNNNKYRRENLVKYIFKLDSLSKEDMKYVLKDFWDNIKSRILKKIKR